METGMPSRTALVAAMHRAAHQVLEDGRIFKDPLAVPILHPEMQLKLVDWATPKGRLAMRVFIAARSRFAETRLAEAVAKGVRQAVIVGAGLDTLGLRNPHGAALNVFEVDHPATQEWKRYRIAAAKLVPPPTLTFTPVNFETETLGEGLAAAGFDARQPAFFIWLGVVPYLTETAVFETLEFIAGIPGAEVVFDYANPIDERGPKAQHYSQGRAKQVATMGEPWLSFFDSAALADRLREMGAVAIEDLGPIDIRHKYFGQPNTEGSNVGGHFLHARW